MFLFWVDYFKRLRTRRLIERYSRFAQLCRERDRYLKQHGKSYTIDNEWDYLHYQCIVAAIKLNDRIGYDWSRPNVLDV